MSQERLPIFPYLLTEERFADYETDMEDPPLFRSFFDLLVLFVWNSEQGFRFVSKSQLEELEISLDGLSNLATEDLAKHASGSLRVEKRDSVFGVFMGGNFEASFVLSEFFWERFLGPKFPNGCIVALPANDMLTFCDPSSSEGVAELREIVARTFDGGEDLLTPVLYERRHGAWNPYLGQTENLNKFSSRPPSHDFAFPNFTAWRRLNMALGLMKYALATLGLVCLGVLTGCQAIQAVSTVVSSSSACARTERLSVFPNKGEIRTFAIAFQLDSMQESYSHSDRVTCRYQGSLCGGGKWFQVWRENKTDGFEREFKSGDTVTYHYHSFCANLFIQPGSGAERRFVVKRQGQHPRLTSFDELSERGIVVESFAIKPSPDAF